MVRTKQSSRDGHARFPPRRKGHFWVENRVGKRQALNGKRDRDDDEIRGDEGVVLLPNRYAERAINDEDEEKKFAAAAGDDEGFDSALGKKGLLDLPNEILTLVFEELVATGGVFHFFPMAPEQVESKEVWCIHHIHPTTSRTSPSMLLDLALTSCRIKDLVYDIFYGQNLFLVQLSHGGIKKSVVQIDEGLVKREGFGGPCGTFRKLEFREGIESWCRVSDQLPLRGNVWKFVRSLKVQIIVGNGEQEMEGVERQIGDIARGFEMAEQLKLRMLEVGFVGSEDGGGDVVTRSLRVVKRDGDDGLSMLFLEDQENDESLRGMAGAFGWIQELLEPLWDIEAVQDLMVVNAPDRLADNERAAKRRKVE